MLVSDPDMIDVDNKQYIKWYEKISKKRYTADTNDRYFLQRMTEIALQKEAPDNLLLAICRYMVEKNKEDLLCK